MADAPTTKAARLNATLGNILNTVIVQSQRLSVVVLVGSYLLAAPLH